MNTHKKIKEFKNSNNNNKNNNHIPKRGGLKDVSQRKI